ncbi:MAG: glycosyltransferase family 2 protein [Bacteroidota bacterium]
MVKISAVIIVFNEERNIERCLKSLTGIADEIVVVDSFSTDATEKLCQPFGVHFIKHVFEGYIEQKSWATSQATYDYVLSLDADEALSDYLRNSIAAVKNNWQADGYSFSRLTNYLGHWIKHCGWYPDVKLRLWDRRKGEWGGQNPHDMVVMQDGCKVVRIAGDLFHYSYYSIRQHIDQFNKFTDISAEEAVAKGKKASLFIAIYKGIWKFKRDYFFKLGFLDGYYGFVICYLSSFATFSKYLKIIELRKLNEKQ